MIGYDDVEMARFSSPPLATIRHPKAELGLLAVQQLVSRIRNEGAGSRMDDGAAGADRPPLGQVTALIAPAAAPSTENPLASEGFQPSLLQRRPVLLVGGDEVVQDGFGHRGARHRLGEVIACHSF